MESSLIRYNEWLYYTQVIKIVLQWHIISYEVVKMEIINEIVMFKFCIILIGYRQSYHVQQMEFYVVFLWRECR